MIFQDNNFCKYRMTITDLKTNIPIEVYANKLHDLFDFIGFKLKRERCGWSGMTDKYEYSILRIR